MADTRDSVIRMYDGALRALDTKSQIFLAFLTITLTPVFSRLSELGLSPAVRAAEAGLFLAACAAFVFCLYPRRGRRSAQGLFDTALRGEQITALLAASDNAHDPSASIATLHDIYRIKARSVGFGTMLLGIYILTVAVTLAIA